MVVETRLLATESADIFRETFVKPNNLHQSIKSRQLELIQRIGRIGYWEYTLETKSMILTEASLKLLDTIIEAPRNSSRSFMEALSDIERERFQTAIDQAIAKRMELNIELELANGAGKTFHIAVRGTVGEIDHELQGFAGIFQDITNEKRTEEQLTRQRDVMKTIIDNFPGAITLCDADLRFTAYNDQFIDLLEFPRELFAKGWVHYAELARFNANRGEYGPGDPEEQVRIMVERAHNFQAHHIERMRPNGRWLEIRGTPIPSGGFVTSYIDITERKNIETELLHSKETAEARREQVANLLDNSGQGFLSFGDDLMVDAECSRACEAMLGQSPAGSNAAEMFFRDDAAKIDLFSTTIASVLAEPDPAIRESMLSLLPTEIQRDDVLLKAEYKTLDNGKFMVVLTDITAERRMAAMLDSERRRLELIVMAVSDSRNFFDIVEGFSKFLADDLPRLLQETVNSRVAARELYREVHTYKGLLNQFSFPDTPQALHDIEGHLADALALGDDLTMRKITDMAAPEALRAPFQKDLAILSNALGEEFLAQGESFILSNQQALQLENLAIRLLRGETIDTSVAEIRCLLKQVGTLRKVSFKDVLFSFDGLVRQVAERLEKEIAPLVVTAGADVWIDPQAFRPFLRSLVHVFRNAVAHGIETPEERWEAEKDGKGTITCSVKLEENIIKLSIADDGAGIDLDALRRQGVAAGIYDEGDVLTVPEEEIVRLIFMDNISTQREVNELAGRGVGLAAVLNETMNLGGEVAIKTVAGRGTEFLFSLPQQHDDLSEAK